MVSTMNSPDGRVKANAAIVPAGVSGAVSVYVTDTTDVILDIDGYFAPASSQTYQFYPLTPCRVVDTRSGNRPGTAALAGGRTRLLPILEQLRHSPAAPHGLFVQRHRACRSAGQPLDYLTVWPSGETQPMVSTLNNPHRHDRGQCGHRAGGQRATATSPSTPTTTHRPVIDINGYFAAAGTGRTVAVSGGALPRAGHAPEQWPALHGREDGERRGQRVRSAQQRRRPTSSTRPWCRRAPCRYLTLWPRRRNAAGGLDAERLRRLHHLEHGDRAHEQRLHRRLRRRADATDPGHLRLLRAVETSPMRALNSVA